MIVSQVRDELAKSKAEVDALNAEHESMSMRLGDASDDHASTLISVKAEKACLETELAALKEKMEMSSELKVLVDDELAETKDYLEKQLMIVSQVRDELAKSKAEVGRLEELSGNTTTDSNEVATLRGLVEELTFDQTKKCSEIATLKSNLSMLEFGNHDAVIQAKEEAVALKDMLRENDETIRKGKEEKDQAEGKILSLQEGLQTLLNELDESTSRSKHLEEVLSETRTTLERREMELFQTKSQMMAATLDEEPTIDAAEDEVFPDSQAQKDALNALASMNSATQGVDIEPEEKETESTGFGGGLWGGMLKAVSLVATDEPAEDPNPLDDSATMNIDDFLD